MPTSWKARSIAPREPAATTIDSDDPQAARRQTAPAYAMMQPPH